MIRLSRAALSLLIEHTSTSLARLHLRSVLFDERRGIAVATDGHSLALMRDPTSSGRGSWLIERGQLEDVARLMRKRHTAWVSAKMIRVCGPEWVPGDKPVAVVPVRYVDATFPPFEQVIGYDAPPEGAFVVSPSLMARALTGLADVVGTRAGVSIHPHGALDGIEIAAQDPDSGNEWLIVLMPMRSRAGETRLVKRIVAAVKEASHG